MNTIVTDFFPAIRYMCSQILVLCFANWPLTIPFVAFALDKLVDLFKKIY